jgi:bisphosphoglycerate-dependent phosphoglycerate mutase family 1
MKTFDEITKVMIGSHFARVPVINSWRLNERHYGALVGKSKQEAGFEFGVGDLTEWRRSWDKAPPKMSHRDLKAYTKASWAQATTVIKEYGKRSIVANEKGVNVPETESLKDCATRAWPLWANGIMPRLARGETVLVVAHANSIRAILKHIDAETMSLDSVRDVHVPSATPLVYEFGQAKTDESAMAGGTTSGSVSWRKVRSSDRFLRPLGEPTPLGMRGRYLITKELVELSPIGADNRSAKESLEDVISSHCDGSGSNTKTFFDLVHDGYEAALDYADSGAGKDEALLITDGTGAVVHANDSWSNLCGFSADEIRGLTNRFLQGPLTDPKSKEKLNEALHSGLPASASLINYRKSGTAFLNEITVLPIHKKPENGELAAGATEPSDSGTRTESAGTISAPTHYIAKLLVTPDLPDLPPLTEEEKRQRGLHEVPVPGVRSGPRGSAGASAAGGSPTSVGVDGTDDDAHAERVGLRTAGAAGECGPFPEMINPGRHVTHGPPFDGGAAASQFDDANRRPTERIHMDIEGDKVQQEP